MYYGKDPFSAESYLRNATGPLGTYFRGMLPDVNSLAMLDPDGLKASWRDDVSWITDHYNFTSEHAKKPRRSSTEVCRADYWFDDPANEEKRAEVLPRPGAGPCDRPRSPVAFVPARESVGRTP